MTKYKQVFMEMIKDHEVEFAKFKDIHDNFAKDRKTFQEEFDREGQKILEIIKEYEDLLTLKTDRGSFSKYSTNLSDKFRDQVRAFFPKIDFVGVKIS